MSSRSLQFTCTQWLKHSKCCNGGSVGAQMWGNGGKLKEVLSELSRNPSGLGVKQGMWKDFPGRGSSTHSGMELWSSTACLENRSSLSLAYVQSRMGDSPQSFTVSVSSSPTVTKWYEWYFLWGNREGRTPGQFHLQFERIWCKRTWLLSPCLCSKFFRIHFYLLSVSSGK